MYGEGLFVSLQLLRLGVWEGRFAFCFSKVRGGEGQWILLHGGTGEA